MSFEASKRWLPLSEVLDLLPRSEVEKLPIIEWGGAKYVEEHIVEDAAKRTNS